MKNFKKYPAVFSAQSFDSRLTKLGRELKLVLFQKSSNTLNLLKRKEKRYSNFSVFLTIGTLKSQ